MNKKNLTLIAVLSGLYFGGCAHRQNIVVTPFEQNGSKGIVELYENGVKKLSFTAMLGKNGVAKEGEKAEGDGKTPSGNYNVSMIFGKSDGNWSMPFIKTHDKLYCIDDSKSKNYNKIIDASKNEKDYDSFEYMLRDDGQYDIGAVIEYNEEAKPLKGSCIFLHIQKNSNSPTAGCVAMQKDDLAALLGALDNDKHPIIQIKER